jgi:hypothetical protein
MPLKTGDFLGQNNIFNAYVFSKYVLPLSVTLTDWNCCKDMKLSTNQLCFSEKIYLFQIFFQLSLF